MPSLNAEIAPDNPPAHLPPTSYSPVKRLRLSCIVQGVRRVCVCCYCCYGRAIADRIALSPLSHRMYRTIHPPTYIFKQRVKKLTILGRRHRRHDGRHLAIPARHPQNSPTILRRLLGIRRLSRRLQWSGLGSSGLRARSCFVLHELRGDKEISRPIQAECFE